MNIIFNNLAMAYGNRLLFADVNLKLTGRTRYALVGANGAGKSTLLRLITGEEETTDGAVELAKSVTMGWLKQDQFKFENVRIVDIVLMGKPALWEALERREVILNKTEFTEEDGFALGEIEETIAHNDGYVAEALAEKLLVGLGVVHEYHQQPLNALSGGYKLRVLLAQTLFGEPDILLLDEPTNHLDILSIAWLEHYLAHDFKGMLVFISHDTDFINRLSQKIIDVDYGEVREYTGNYDQFLAQKKLVEEQKLSERATADKKIEQLQIFVNKFKAKASKAKQAQSKMKQMEKIEVPDVKKSSRRAPKLDFVQKRPSGKKVLEIQGLTKSYDDDLIFKEVGFQVARGEKIAIIGVNGVGKSTLLKTLLGKVVQDGGDYEWGHETHISYFSQDHHEALKESQSVEEWAENSASHKTSQDIRKVLGQMLFSKDDVKKSILSISGGEAARLLLASIMMQHGNVLVLDEPTNHMDLESTDALAKALVKFDGTLLMVSHNRYFIRKIANRILFITHDGIEDFHGSFDEFEEMMG
jgi:ATPase subunit of ABC transporter with duplicated ATPase domains